MANKQLRRHKARRAAAHAAHVARKVRHTIASLPASILLLGTATSAPELLRLLREAPSDVDKPTAEPPGAAGSGAAATPGESGKEVLTYHLQEERRRANGGVERTRCSRAFAVAPETTAGALTAPMGMLVYSRHGARVLGVWGGLTIA